MTGINTEHIDGRYIEIYIDGVPDGSIAYDKEENSLIVDGDVTIRKDNGGEYGALIDLPTGDYPPSDR